MPTAGLIGSQRRRDDQPPSPGTVARLLGAFNEGLVDTAGAPVDLVNGALRWSGVPVSNTPYGGSANLRDVLHGIGIGQLGQQFAPQSGAERYGQSVARSLGQVALPVGATLGIGGKLATASGMFAGGGSVGNAMRSAAVDAAQNPSAALASNTGAAAGSGVGGQAARDAFPGNFWADLAAQLLGGGVGAGALSSLLARGARSPAISGGQRAKFVGWETGDTNGAPYPSYGRAADDLGPFGPIHADLSNDWSAGLRRLREQGGEIPGAFYHPEIGLIDAIWGTPGKAGGGIAHIDSEHPDVVERLDQLIPQLPIVQRSSNRVQLDDTNHHATIRLGYDRQTKRWLLTAFRNDRDLNR